MNVMTPELRGWLGDPAVRDDFLARMAAHRTAERLVKQTYGEGRGERFRGCAVGCTLQQGKAHHLYPSRLGWPEWLAHMEDKVFEGLPEPEHLQWPEQLMQAVPVGLPEAVFTRVRDLFLLQLLQEQALPCAKTERVRTAIERVIALYQRRLAGDEPKRQEWHGAAAADAADAAYYADDAASYAAAAAASYAADAASYAARFAAWRWVAQTVLDLLRQEGAAWLASEDGAPYRAKQLAV